ncbi:MAG: hypothetical protein WCK77_14505 [Verrucomicrobiota bacterium]
MAFLVSTFPSSPELHSDPNNNTPPENNDQMKNTTSSMHTNPDECRTRANAETEVTASASNWAFIEHAFELTEPGNPEFRPPHWRQSTEQSLGYQLANGPWLQPTAMLAGCRKHIIEATKLPKQLGGTVSIELARENGFFA